MAKQRTLKTTELTAIRTLLREGHPYAEIAQRLDLTYNQLRGAIDRHRLLQGLPPRQHNLSPFTPEENLLIQEWIVGWIETERLTAQQMAIRIHARTGHRIAKQNVLARIAKLDRHARRLFRANYLERRARALSLIHQRRQCRQRSTKS